MKEKTDHFFKIPEKNIIPELLTDEQYKVLTENHFLHNIRLRNFRIELDRKEMIKQGFGKKHINTALLNKYPHLKRSTIRRIK